MFPDHNFEIYIACLIILSVPLMKRDENECRCRRSITNKNIWPVVQHMNFHLIAPEDE